MARRKPKSRRKQSQPRARRTPSKSGTRQETRDAAETSAPQAQGLVEDELAETYGYVRRDLMRIAILAVILFAVIFVSPFFLL